MTIEKRGDRVAFRISGPEATRLLHDVLTPPVLEEDGAARWFALLAPQGKILAEGLIGWAEGAHWLDVHASVAENFFKRMKMYRLRAKMEIEMLAESHAVGWAAEAAAGVVHRDGRAEGLGFRVIAPVAEAEGWAEGKGQAKARIAAGIAELGPDFDADDVFPHDIGMDHLGGVDFKKGCYVGQEVVSRMQHRGTARRRPAIVSGIGAGGRGDAITIGGKSIGTLGAVVDGSAVAIVRIDKVSDPEAATVGGAPVSLALPQWARYGFAQPGSDSTEKF